MALIVCSDCSAHVSDAAPACLKCGRPIAGIGAPMPSPISVVREGGKYEAAGFGLIMAGIAMWFVAWGLGAGLVLLGFVVFLIGRFK